MTVPGDGSGVRTRDGAALGWFDMAKEKIMAEVLGTIALQICEPSRNATTVAPLMRSWQQFSRFRITISFTAVGPLVWTVSVTGSELRPEWQNVARFPSLQLLAAHQEASAYGDNKVKLKLAGLIWLP